MTSSGLFFSVSSTPAPAAADVRVRMDVLARLVELYGRELAPILYGIGHAESRWNLFAKNESAVERSYGVFQINEKAWGEGAAGELGNLESQLEAARPVVNDAAAGAQELVEAHGVDFADAFSLVWNYGRPRARSLLRKAGTLAALAIAPVMGPAAYLAWMNRQKAYRAAYELALAALATLVGPIVVAGAGGFFLLLVAAAVYSSSRTSSRKKKR